MLKAMFIELHLDILVVCYLLFLHQVAAQGLTNLMGRATNGSGNVDGRASGSEAAGGGAAAAAGEIAKAGAASS